MAGLVARDRRVLNLIAGPDRRKEATHMSHPKTAKDISFCGYRCRICPAFKDNITGPQDQQRTSDGWFKYYGFRIPPERIVCDGCRAPDSEQPRRIDTECPVRPCATAKGLPNCAHCDEYVCDKLKQRLVDIDEVIGKQQEPIPPQDFDRFLKPYDNKPRLQTIRSELAEGR
jgi:hypothetical protein